MFSKKVVVVVDNCKTSSSKYNVHLIISGIPERKSQPLCPHHTDFEHPNDVKMIDPHTNLHSDYVKEYSSHHPGQGEIGHHGRWFNGDHSYDTNNAPLDSDGDHDHREKKVYGNYKYLTNGDQWHPEQVHPHYKRTHHGEPDWNHQHDWIDHGAQAKPPEQADPEVEDDNIFEALQDDPDNIRHFDDQLNQVEYKHDSKYHHRSYHDMNHKELFQETPNKTKSQGKQQAKRYPDTGHHQLIESQHSETAVKPLNYDERNHIPDTDGVHIEGHADDHDIRYQQHHPQLTTTAAGL